MRWENAVRHAREQARVTGQRWFVLGYRKLDGSWRYGAYRERPAFEAWRR